MRSYRNKTKLVNNCDGGRNGRVEWLDVLKCLVMLLVFFGHAVQDKANTPYAVKYFIYAFHMPLFFIISGMGLYLQLNKYSFTPVELLKNKVKTLLWPYIAFNTLMVPLWIYNHKVLSTIDQKPSQLFIATLYSNEKWMSLPTGTTWFITCLFLVTIVFYILMKCTHDNSVFIAIGSLLIGLAGYYVSLKYVYNYPWHIGTVPIACMMFAIGYLFMKHKEIFNKLAHVHLGYKLVLIFVFIALGAFISSHNTRVSMVVNIYGNFGLFVGAALCFSIASYILCTMIPPLKIFKLIGRNTMVYLAIHEQLFITMKLYNANTKAIITDYPYLTALAVFIILIPVAWVVENWLPFLIGKKKRTFK